MYKIKVSTVVNLFSLTPYVRKYGNIITPCYFKKEIPDLITLV